MYVSCDSPVLDVELANWIHGLLRAPDMHALKETFLQVLALTA